MKLNNLRCIYNISVHTRYNITHVIIFIDDFNKHYVWTTANCKALSYKEGNIYDIETEVPDKERNSLSKVELINEYKIQESEQQKDKTKIDAIDILLGIKNYNDKNLTND